MREDGQRNGAGRGIAGVGLRAPHVAEVLRRRPPVPFLEVHAENHMGDGRAFELLARIRNDNAISIHGVGLSLGGAERPDAEHLARFAALVRRIDPVLVSEHLAWCRVGASFLNDLFPVRYDCESLASVARNIEIAQDAVGRRLLIENPSHYAGYADTAISETQFIAALCRKTGCGLLLDVNNVVVSAHNLAFSARQWLAKLPDGIVGEIHVAGHAAEDDLLIDTHGAPVGRETWALYREALGRFGPQPTLVERDRDLPELDDLLAEARLADLIAAEPMEETHAAA
jgi:uncharacterized protein (UPF0276 family)